MILNIKVKANAKENKIIFDEKLQIWKLSTTATPEKGKANEKVIKIVSDYFDKPKSNITIISGSSSNLKKIELLN